MNKETIKNSANDLLLIVSALAIATVVILFFMQMHTDPKKAVTYIQTNHTEAINDLFKKGEISNEKMFKATFHNIESEYQGIHLASIHKNPEMIDLFINKGADINSQQKDGKTALHFIVENNDMPSLQRISRGKINTNIQDNKGESPLFTAIRNNNAEMVKSLISLNASVDITNRKKETPLHVACRIGNSKIIQLIINQNPNLYATDQLNLRPSDIIKRRVKDLTNIYIELNPRKKREQQETSEWLPPSLLPKEKTHTTSTVLS